MKIDCASFLNKENRHSKRKRPLGDSETFDGYNNTIIYIPVREEIEVQ